MGPKHRLHNLRYITSNGAIIVIFKPGGVESWDQSRSRSRFHDLSRSTFETCRDYPSCRDQNFLFLGRDTIVIVWYDYCMGMGCT
jgi:hypothetical protein